MREGGGEGEGGRWRELGGQKVGREEEGTEPEVYTHTYIVLFTLQCFKAAALP